MPSFGQIRNVLTHSLVHAIQEETPKIAALLGTPVPPAAMPSMVRCSYTGNAVDFCPKISNLPPLGV